MGNEGRFPVGVNGTRVPTGERFLPIARIPNSDLQPGEHKPGSQQNPDWTVWVAHSSQSIRWVREAGGGGRIRTKAKVTFQTLLLCSDGGICFYLLLFFFWWQDLKPGPSRPELQNSASERAKSPNKKEKQTPDCSLVSQLCSQSPRKSSALKCTVRLWGGSPYNLDPLFSFLNKYSSFLALCVSHKIFVYFAFFQLIIPSLKSSDYYFFFKNFQKLPTHYFD